MKNRTFKELIEELEILVMPYVDVVDYKPNMSTSSAFMIYANPKAKDATDIMLMRLGKPSYFTRLLIEDTASDKEKLMTIAHESGHAYDFIKNYNSFMTLWMADNVIKKEVNAWLIGIDFLNAIGFTRWDEYIVFGINCIYSYFKEYGMQKAKNGFCTLKEFEGMLYRKLQEIYGKTRKIKMIGAHTIEEDWDILAKELEQEAKVG